MQASSFVGSSLDRFPFMKFEGVSLRRSSTRSTGPYHESSVCRRG